MSAADDTNLIGRNLGHHRLLEKIGRGGMGVVYLAEDTSLKRQVALKILPPELAEDRDRLERFHREAEVLATLDHPNIVTIYSIDSANMEDENLHFLTMQLVDGGPLADSIPTEGLPLERLFRIAIPLADALAAAHERGVIHRDLKPANIMISRTGVVKILDFGLAKMRQVSTSQEDSRLPTAPLTQVGVVVGTVPYMSPEQIKGQEADSRSDLFSLGCVLYEMAVGTRPFQGESSAEVVSSILRDTPKPIDTLRPDLPHHLGRIVRRCLDKDPIHRFQTARDVHNELQDLETELSLSSATRQPVAATDESTRDIRSIAVLPLDNLSGDKEQEYFADGMTEALITDLARIGALKVISRTSIMQYQGVRKPLPQIAKELAVDAVIEGSVLRIGETVRITTQLIDARTDEHLWAEHYDHDVRDVLTLMSTVAREVAGEVRVKLTSAERSLLAPKRRLDPLAHEAYLKGRYFLNQLTREGLDRAQRLMMSAIDIDPTYAQAHAGLADCFNTFVLFGWLDYSQGLPLARAAAREALDLDETLADAHAILASVEARERNYETAEARFRRAIALSPNHARAHGDYSHLLIWIGRLDQAIAEAGKALELEPLSLMAGIDLTSAYYFARRYDDSERQNRDVLSLHPGAPYAEWCLGVCLTQQERYDEAIETFLGRKVPTAATNWALGYVYGIVGRHDEARAILEYLLEKSKRQFVSPAMIAYVHLGLGDKEKALDLLEETFEEKGGRLIYLQVDPWLDPLRGEPRFQDLLRRMSFPTV